MLQRKRAFIFDFDGTLASLNIDFAAMRRQVYQIIESHGLVPSQFDPLYILEVIDAVAAELACTDTARSARFSYAAHAAIVALESEAARHSGMLPGAVETLQALRRWGFKVGIVTRNSGVAVRTICTAIDQLCDVFLPRDAVRFAKPHPEHLQRALEGLHVSAHEAVMIGDGPIDIDAGKALGLMTVAVLTGGRGRQELLASQPDLILDSVADLIANLSQDGATTPYGSAKDETTVARAVYMAHRSIGRGHEIAGRLSLRGGMHYERLLKISGIHRAGYRQYPFHDPAAPSIGAHPRH
jgi:phosphoglycolate phosphatase